LSLLLPELILIGVASLLFLLGLSSKAASRRLAPVLALLSLLAVLGFQIYRFAINGPHTEFDTFGGGGHGTLRVAAFAQYIQLITAAIGILLVLLAWPTNADATGNGSLQFGADAGEFFALMLLSLAGVLLVAGANDIMLLFLGIELASIPTYIMVALSRPLPVAQEAGVKYFFLGAFAAAIMLFGFSYLYGTTGSTNLHDIMLKMHPGNNWTTRITLTSWQSLAVIMLIAGFAFKMAAVPLHFYAGDVYQGAATPVTAFLSFVPKATGFVALIKILFALGGPNWILPDPIVRPNGTGLLWILAILTMSVGNVLGLLQYNVNRVFAYSSIAHTGYMLVALAALATAQFVTPAAELLQANGLQAVLFYLAAYGLMNIGAFGVLQLLPARDGKGSAETFEDLAGTGRKHVALGLAMAICCFSLIGIPLTVGFMGKLMIIKPALAAASTPMKAGAVSVHSAMTWLIIIMMANAAISAAYYLKIVATMFLRTEESAQPAARPPLPVFARPAIPILLAVFISALGTLLFGTVTPAIERLAASVDKASQIEGEFPAAPAQPTTRPIVAATR
jgi:NADH-quinone oxidoreductase subunit N